MVAKACVFSWVEETGSGLWSELFGQMTASPFGVRPVDAGVGERILVWLLLYAYHVRRVDMCDTVSFFLCLNVCLEAFQH